MGGAHSKDELPLDEPPNVYFLLQVEGVEECEIASSEVVIPA